MLKHIFLSPGPPVSPAHTWQTSCNVFWTPPNPAPHPCLQYMHCSLLTFLIPLNYILFSLQLSQWLYIGEIRNRTSPPVSECFIYCASFSPNSACWVAPAFPCHKCLCAFLCIIWRCLFDPAHCAAQLSSKPFTKSTPFRLAFLCCSAPQSFMQHTKPNPDATEVIWNVAICFTEMKTEFTVCSFKYYEWREVGSEMTGEKESLSSLLLLNRSCELLLLRHVSSHAAVFCHLCRAMLNLDCKFLTLDSFCFICP